MTISIFKKCAKPFASLLLLISPGLWAQSYDFESGTLQGWLSTTTGGGGNTGVVTHNGSKMGYVHHAGYYSHTIYRDFVYLSDNSLSFDMQAVASRNGAVEGSKAGVVITFLNSINSTLGSMGIVNATDLVTIGAKEFRVDSLEHHYSNTFGTFAALAGLDQSTQISKISIQYFASGYGGFTASTGDVWFDNIQVSSVPEPASELLLIAGLLIALPKSVLKHLRAAA